MSKDEEVMSADFPDEKSRLAVMPLAVLLPKLGSVTDLTRIAPALSRRLKDIPEGNAGPEEPANAQRLRSEETMLNQVMQWLSVGRPED